jgi:hypothetical protein
VLDADFKFRGRGADGTHGGRLETSVPRTVTATEPGEALLRDMPSTATAGERSSAPAWHGGRDKTQLRALVEQMRQAVVRATLASDLATKVESWEAYRSARAEALALFPTIRTPVSGG